MVRIALNLSGKEVASARIKITVRMIRKLLLKTEPRLDMVAPAKLISVAGEKLPKAEAKSRLRSK